jgi:hypothetical protein
MNPGIRQLITLSYLSFIYVAAAKTLGKSIPGECWS